MNEMNLTIKPIAGNVECDLTAIKNHLDEQLELYRNMVFTEETKKDAKTSVAELRKGKKALADNIKEAKEKYMIPWNAFNEKAQEIVKLFDEPIDVINEQISAFEEKRKSEKREQIKAAYEEIIADSDIKDYVTLEKIFDARWENATVSINQIKSAMCEIKLNSKTAIATIKSMNSDIEDRVLANYFNDFDLPKAIQTISNHEQQKRDILAREQERIQRETEERIRREEREKIAAEKAKAEEIERAKAEAVEIAQAEVIESFIPDNCGEILDVTYYIKLTEDAKAKLEMFMDSIGIEYEEVKPF